MKSLPIKTSALSLLVLIVLSTGCTINHPVAQDYPAYLDTDSYPQVLPKSEQEYDYKIEGETSNHSYEFRAASAGFAHLWIVEFGKILDTTLQAGYVQEAFGRLSKVSDSDNSASPLTFKLESYRFENFQAYITMEVTVSNADVIVSNKSYSAVGVNQAGAVLFGGVFAMKNSILQSTKFAIDDILVQMINDL